MPISPGDKLGPYEILSSIGKGGMGEVWKAHDPRLKRDVAIKISAAQFSERFAREAQAIAALNHPNICQIYDVGPDYLVMEFIEGESPKGPMPLDEALRIARQIADALEAAHEKGITHRDLKPGNIKIKPDGTVKVLDFGLAKIHAGPASSGENSPTLTIGMTQAGMILGTAAYMAPEQARGKETVDKRADIWAFGVVLYELLTGKRLFEGEDVGHTLAAVIMQEPDLSSVPAEVLPLLKRCLEKDPKKRLRDIGDAWALLAEETPAQLPLALRHRSWLPWCIAAFLLLALMPANILHFRETVPQQLSLRVQIPLPDKVLTADQRISPDGRYLVFAGTGSGTTEQQLWVRSLNSLATQPLAGTEGAIYPFWSPDSKSIGFFAGGKLKRIEAAGGPALTLADAPNGRGGTWFQDGNGGGVILFNPMSRSPILRVTAGGGTVSPVTKLRTGDISNRFPWFLPDGRHFLYSATHEANTDHNTIHVRDLSSPEDRVVGEADSQAIYSQGFLLFSRQETLMAQPFDAQRGVATGDAAPLEQQIQRLVTSAYADFSASTNGLLAFSTGSAGDNLQLTWVDRSGKQLGTLGEPANINDFHFSPDRKSVAAALLPSGTLNNADIWIYDATRGLRTRFTFDPAVDNSPVWSPDGRSIIFASNRKQHFDLYRKSSDGAGADELLYSDNLEKSPTSWSADGKFLLYRAPGAGTGNDVWVLPLTPERPGAPLKPFPFAQAPFNEGTAQFSPDGRWVAYVSDESQRAEVYVARFPGAGGKRQISVAGGITPRWRRDGKEIFYLGPDAKVMSAAVTVKGDALEAGEVRPLFGRVALATTAYHYDVSADGQRFLIVPPPQASPGGVTVVQNWTAGLKK
jgi:eukaryotic-like serine/threonine-protein kinase